MINQQKLNIALICGGNSSEHDVSERSAKNIYDNLDKNKYRVFLFLMTKNGILLDYRDSYLILFGGASEKDATQHSLANKHTPTIYNNALFNVHVLAQLPQNTVFFPIIHGNLGEDGTVQGLFRLLDRPYVGSGITASGIAFDKDLTKQILTDQQIPNTKYVLLTPHSYKNWTYDKLAQKLGRTIFIKPSRQGSSVGIHKITDQKQLDFALKDAFQYDPKVLAEQAILNHKEIEVSVIGNQFHHLMVSKPGAVITPKSDAFYTYQNKFVDSSKVHFEIPAKISKQLTNTVQLLALDTYQALNLSGMARIDFLVDKHDHAYVGEANTLPGFTNISLFPQLWKAQGLTEPKLLDKLINLAIQRYHDEHKISHSYVPLPNQNN